VNEILTALFYITFASIMACIMVLVHNDSSSEFQTQDKTIMFLLCAKTVDEHSQQINFTSSVIRQ